MNNIPSADVSPRVQNGVIRWYAGDTFDLQLNIELVDQDGDPITITAGQSVVVTFYDKSLNTVKTFEFTNIVGNKVTMDFDATCTALFPKGSYTYDVIYNGAERVTIADSNKVVVE